MNLNDSDYECTKKCRNLEHGQKITSALTKRSVHDNSLVAYMIKVCQNFSNISDCLGRNGLHMAASVNRYAICEWLLNNGALINAKDNESGSSPLHRALFYGCIDCAVLLIKYGANLEILDSDTCRPFQNICKMKNLSLNLSNYNDLLVWGSNKNYNLGIGNSDFSKIPQFIDLFRKDNISISTMALSTFHSLFLDKKGNLYSVGSGSKGRLGINLENNLALPKRVTKLNIKNSEEKIVQLSVSRYHSMILTSKGLVHVCGSNEYKQLGFKPAPEMLLTFKEVPSFQQCGINSIGGIIAKDYYSIAYTTNELYVWGKNLGQFGHLETSEEILLPKKIQIPDSKQIECVEACSSAIAVSTTGKHIFLFYNYKIKVIKPPVLEAVKSLSLIVPDIPKGKKDSKEKTLPTLQMLLLSDTNVLYIWFEDIQQYLRCTFTQYKLPVIDKIFFKDNQVFLLSQGDIYIGKCNKVPLSNVIKESETAWLSSTQSKKDINSNYKIRIDIKRIEGIDRAVDIFCDENFESYAVLQEHSKKYYILPKLHTEEYNFKKLLNDVNEFDSIHDLIFHVDCETFYAHKFIIYSRSKGLKFIIEQFNDKDIYLNYKNFTGKMFELILKYIYSNYFLTLDDIDDINNSLGSNEKHCNLMETFLDIAEKFILTDLVLYIKSIYETFKSKSTAKSFDRTKSRFNRVKRSHFPELYDVTVKCANNKQLRAHKCVLITRLEYFNLMFTHSWSETNTISLTTVPLEYIEPIIDFLYTADVDYFRKQNYSESFLYNMIVICDQFFINRLRKICEILILEKISIRKCGELLEFAESYNCEIIKRGCMDFICQNLARVLYQRSLEICEPETLKNINNHYRQIFQNIFDYRHITPDSESVSDEELLLLVEGLSIDLDHKVDENVMTPKTPKIKSKQEKFRIDKRNYEKDAILSKIKELDLENKKLILEKEKEIVNKETANIFKEAIEINEKIILKSASWTKINDKKDQKRKSGNFNLNSILKDEEKPKENFENINKIIKSPSSASSSFSKSLENTSFLNNNDTEEVIESTSRHSLNFGDFTPLKNNKMSQKERKRLSSESSTKTFETTIKQTDSPTKPISIPTDKPIINNAWGIITTPPSHSSDIDLSSSFSKFTKSKTDKAKNTSISESSDKNLERIDCSNTNRTISKNLQQSFTGTISKSPGSYSNRVSSQLNDILEDEKRQKEYLENMRTKSLVLTQIEEKAIDELRQFYNVDNCEDEIITIARKPMHINFNLPKWQKS